MKVELKNALPATITLNDIPVGQVFSGTIVGSRTGIRATGVFYKAYGRWKNTVANISHDCAVVRLDSTNNRGFAGEAVANLWIVCSPVENYKPLNVKLVEE